MSQINNVKYNVALHCQSTTINGLATSISMVLNDPKTQEVVDSFYVEIEYGGGIQYDLKAKQMFKHREGVKPVSPEMAIYLLWEFTEKYLDMEAEFEARFLVHGNHSIKVLDNFCKHVNYEYYMEVFDDLVIDTMSYALLINNFVSKASTEELYLYSKSGTDLPSISYDAVLLGEGVREKLHGGDRAMGVLEIYKSMLSMFSSEFSEAVKRPKCNSCGATAVEGDVCVICGVVQ